LSGQHIDPELNDVLQDPELLRLAGMLSQAETQAPPLDDAFKSALRRQLMDVAWRSAEGKDSWWRQWLSPPRLSWVGAAAVVVMIASVVIYTAAQPPGGFNEIIVQSPQADQSAVALRQPILVSFNQPMDHPSTEKAVQITPATNVTFAWNGDAKMFIQPVSGDLAPNTQYQVTIGPGALTKTQQSLAAPTTITFVTQPSTPPAPTPSPSPKPNTSLLTNVQQLANIGDGIQYSPQWSADSGTVYFVTSAGALESVQAKGGSASTLVTDGASLPAISPAGDRLAYVRSGKIFIIALPSGSSVAEIDSAATALTWVNDKLYWGSGAGIFTLGDSGPVQLSHSPDSSGGVISIAPDGKHAAFQSGNTLLLLEVATGHTVPLGGVGAPATFQGWSPNGARVVYGGIVADMNGRTINTLPAGDVAWSAKNRILLGSETAAYSLRPDGTNLIKLADGTFRLPAWAPDSNSFAFVRGSALWVATAPATPTPPPSITQATTVVTGFMNARLQNEPDKARTFLDDAGKVAYASGNPQLIPSSDLQFKRFYILVAEVDPSSTNTARVVVRMVFGKNKQEKVAIEETLIVHRALSSDPFLIDGVSASAQRDLGKGPEVVSVKVTNTEVIVTFDSDLLPNSIGGVILQDSTGAAVQVTPDYKDRTLTFSGLQLQPGVHYRVIVQTSVQDVGNRHPAAEYDLEFVGPAADPTSGGSTPPPQPSPSPAPAASPVPSPTPSPG